MQYILTPYAQAQEPFAWWEGAFNEQQLNWLQQQARNWQQKAGVGGGGVGGREPRHPALRAYTGYPTRHDTQWVFETLGHVVSSLNAQFFGFDLLGFGEQIQLTNYDGSEQGMYGWHVDMGPHTNFTLQKTFHCCPAI
jgi:hypothetical protein